MNLRKERRYVLKNNLKAIRKNHRLTLQELANRSEIDITTLQYIEAGKRNPSGEVMLLIAKGLGIEGKKTFWNLFYLEKRF